MSGPGVSENPDFRNSDVTVAQGGRVSPGQSRCAMSAGASTEHFLLPIAATTGTSPPAGRMSPCILPTVLTARVVVAPSSDSSGKLSVAAIFLSNFLCQKIPHKFGKNALTPLI